MFKDLKKTISTASEQTIRNVVILLCLLLVGFFSGFQAVKLSAIWLYAFATIVSNTMKLYQLFKNSTKGRSISESFGTLFSALSFVYFLVSTIVVIILCASYFPKISNVYLLIISGFIVLSLIIMDLINKKEQSLDDKSPG